MTYLFFVYADEQQWDAMSTCEHNALGNEYLANDELLRKRGPYGAKNTSEPPFSRGCEPTHN